jgi:hypothetical protein
MDGHVSWLRAIRLSMIMLIVCYVTFLLVPNDLMTYLSRHTTPQRRDLLVTLWWAAAFVAASSLFVRLQRKRGQ